MAALSYATRIKRTTAGGLTEMLISLAGVNSGDTVDLAPDLTKVIQAVMVAPTSGAPSIYSGTVVAGSVVTLNAGGANQPPTLVKDDTDLLVIGPALAT